MASAQLRALVRQRGEVQFRDVRVPAKRPDHRVEGAFRAACGQAVAPGFGVTLVPARAAFLDRGQWASFSPTTPPTIIARKSARARVTGSPRANIPYRAVPRVPTATQTA